jgi:hypothetical protein
MALAAIRAADMVICPTLPDLFNLGSLQDTVQLLEAAEKLSATVAVINNVDQAGAAARVGEAKAVIGNLKMLACPVIVHHWPQFQTAAEKGKGVTEAGARAKKAADEIRAMWNFLDQHGGAHGARSLVQQPTKSRKVSKKAREAAKS